MLVAIASLAWSAAPAISQPKVVKIGDLGSKVGVFEGYGKYQTMMMQMAVEELNAKGGVLGNKLEMISEDDETKPAPAVRKAEKLILQDEVKLLVGAVSCGATLAVMDVTKKHKTIHWNSVSCAEFMRTTKFHKYYFSNQPDSRMQATGLAKYIVDKMGKKVYIFYTDYAMGQSDGASSRPRSRSSAARSSAWPARRSTPRTSAPGSAPSTSRTPTCCSSRSRGPTRCG